jgi:lysylphosphatidylglycerol synthetase-like protein (DUF2156 family)
VKWPKNGVCLSKALVVPTRLYLRYKSTVTNIIFSAFIYMNMAHSLVLLSFLLLFTFSNTLLAQDTQWTTPPPAGNTQDFTENPIYVVNSVVQLAWVTSSSSYSIWLWQQAGGGIGAATTGSQIYSEQFLILVIPFR